MSLQLQPPLRVSPVSSRWKSLLPTIPIGIYAFVCLHLEEIHKSESLATTPSGMEAFHIDVAPGLLAFGTGVYFFVWLLWDLLGRSRLSLQARCCFFIAFFPIYTALVVVGYDYGVVPYVHPQPTIVLDDAALVCNRERIPWSSIAGLEEYSALDNHRGSILGWAIITLAAAPPAPAAKTWCRITPMIEPSHAVYTAIERHWRAQRRAG
jgi:hypothetical protein